MSIREWTKLYQAECALTHAATTQVSEQYRLRALERYFEDRPLDRAGLTLFLQQQPGARGGNGAAVWRVARAFCRWCVRAGYLETDPTLQLHPRFGEPTPSLPPTYAEVEQILAPLDQRTFVGRRDRALFLTVYLAGLRCSEANQLRRESVDLAGRQLAILGKGSRGRTVPICTPLLAVLARWLGHVTGQFVFPAEGTDHPRSRGQVSRDWTALARAAKLGRRIRLHDLRHGFATALYDDGVDLGTIQHLLGHRSLAMTMRYAHQNARRSLSEVDRVFGKPGKERRC